MHVHTDTPLESRELTQAETIPPGGLASLLLQGEVCTTDGDIALLSDSSWAVASEAPPDWTQSEPHDVRTIDPKQVLCHVASGLTPADRVYAWERGRPPMLPWGDLPLFGETPRYPRAVRYTVTLPAGAVQAEKPQIQGTVSAFLDGIPISFAAGTAALPADGRTHQLRLDVSAPSPDGGLIGNITVRLRPRQTELGDWRAWGLAWFSGRALYKKTVTLHKDPGLRYTLDLGRVCFCAEIWINGALRGTCIWPPYRVDITDHLQNGRNEIAVAAANSAACARRHMLVDEGMALAWNRYWNEDNIDREPEALVSGLLGPVAVTGWKGNVRASPQTLSQGQFP